MSSRLIRVQAIYVMSVATVKVHSSLYKCLLALFKDIKILFRVANNADPRHPWSHVHTNKTIDIRKYSVNFVNNGCKFKIYLNSGGKEKQTLKVWNLQS